MITLYIGYEKKLDINLHVMVKSLLDHTSEIVNVIPLQTELIKEYTRPEQENQSTSFSFSRFLVPYLNNYNGWAIFMDSDMLFLDDITELWNTQNQDFDVQVVQHPDYTCRQTNKFFNIAQTNYPRKNWSSVMLFNCDKCKKLTPEYVNTASASNLHGLHWATSIGSLDSRWNVLVGENISQNNPAVLHYTYGTPMYVDNCPAPYDSIWMDYYRKLNVQ